LSDLVLALRFDNNPQRSTEHTFDSFCYPGPMGFRWQQVGSGPPSLFDADELIARHVGAGEYRGMEFFEVHAKSVVNRVPSTSSMPFEWTINPYRGCTHACSYCFARPTHDYLGLDIGEGFDRQIVVKVNAVERARIELDRRRWPGHPIALGTNTDPYQRAEGKYHLTRGLIAAMAEGGSSFSVLTKSTLIVRDIAELRAAQEHVQVRANLSIGTLDADVWRLTEPGTPPPWKRMEAVARLNDAGIPCGVFMAPVIPGVSDSDAQLRAVVSAAVDAGAVSISAGYLYLRDPVRQIFFDRLRADDPATARRLEQRYRERSYLSTADQRGLTERIRALVELHRRPLKVLQVDATDHIMSPGPSVAAGGVRDRVAAMGLGRPSAAPNRTPAVAQASLFD
jgi:DNA repair photolyase